MSLFAAALLGVVEGLTEFLPVSSTAHLVLASEVLRLPQNDFLGSFIIAIQLGAIGAIVLLYWRTIFLDVAVMKRLIVAFVPTAIVGFVLYKLFKSYFIENLPLIGGALLVGGIILVMFEKWARPPAAPRSELGAATGEAAAPISSMSYRTAFLIGCAQSLAIVPGVSRAGATILGGLVLGVGRKEIVEFSFLLAIPTMLAATSYDLLKSGASFATGDWEVLAVGFTVSFIAAYASVRWLLRFVQTHTFTGFGWYRIVLGCGVLAIIAYAA